MKISNWREIVKMPVVLEFHVSWNVNILRNILMNYVKVCAEKNLLENKGSICTTLSGGVDSTLCLAIIRGTMGWDVPIHTFTTGKNDKHPDIHLARLASGIFNTEHHELIPSSEYIKKAKKILGFTWAEKKLTQMLIIQSGIVHVANTQLIKRLPLVTLPASNFNRFR